MARLLAWIERSRARYKRLPVWLRSIAVLLAIVAGVAGVVAMFTPLAILEMGTILVSLSLGVLSLEFDWAHTVLVRLTGALADRVVRRRMLMFVAGVLATYAVVGVYWIAVRGAA